jgi:hypothetical protein
MAVVVVVQEEAQLAVAQQLAVAAQVEIMVWEKPEL